ncbi:hypothetical protein M8494_03125 [Serratia ureilytica]
MPYRNSAAIAIRSYAAGKISRGIAPGADRRRAVANRWTPIGARPNTPPRTGSDGRQRNSAASRGGRRSTEGRHDLHLPARDRQRTLVAGNAGSAKQQPL